ncbi:cuticle protein CP14.6 [Aedes albopictus]|uniref:Secreted protein n=1 Tax=Aedes albopictus TaxID=7160 RepID=A0ABM1Y5C8_AEDAL
MGNVRILSTFVIGIMVAVIVCHAAPIELVGDVINEITPEGYDLMYTLSNGVTRSEVGTLTTTSDGSLVITVKGTWAQPFEDGLYYDIEFSADENGFRPRFVLGKNIRRKVKGSE